LIAAVRSSKYARSCSQPIVSLEFFEDEGRLVKVERVVVEKLIFLVVVKTLLREFHNLGATKATGVAEIHRKECPHAVVFGHVAILIEVLRGDFVEVDVVKNNLVMPEVDFVPLLEKRDVKVFSVVCHEKMRLGVCLEEIESVEQKAIFFVAFCCEELVNALLVKKAGDREAGLCVFEEAGGFEVEEQREKAFGFQVFQLSAWIGFHNLSPRTAIFPFVPLFV